MCKFRGKSNERILCNLSKKEILRLYSIVHVAMETTKTSNFNHQSKSFISIFFACQVSACELIWQMTYTHKLPKLCSAALNVLKWQPFKVNIWRGLHSLWGRGEKKACEDQWESHCSRGHRQIFTNFFLFATWFFCDLNKCDNLLTSSEVDIIMSSDPAIKGRQAFTAAQAGDERLL